MIYDQLVHHELLWKVISISELGFSQDTYKCLANAGCRTLMDLLRMSMKEVESIAGIDNARSAEIVRVLAEHNLVLDYDETISTNVSRIAPGYPENLFAALSDLDPTLSIRQDCIEDHKNALSAVLLSLSERDETLIILRYKYLASLSTIGYYYNLTREGARQAIKKALIKLTQSPYREMITHGLRGHIDVLARQLAEEKAAALLEREYLRGFSEGVAVGKNERLDPISDNEKMKLLLGKSVNELNLTIRTSRCLQHAGITTVADLLCYRHREEVQGIRNIGKKIIEEIAMRLRELGISGTVWETF